MYLCNKFYYYMDKNNLATPDLLFLLVQVGDYTFFG